jgi:hypothetical protein
MRRLLPLGFATVAALLGGTVGPASASLITFSFTGTVTQFNADPDDPFGGGIGFGTAIAGSYTFESTTPDSAAAATTGSYQMAGPPFGVTATMAGEIFSITDFLAINVADDFGGSVDQYGVLACAGGPGSCFSTTGSGALTIGLFLEGPTGIFGSDGLPLTAPPLASFATRDFRLFANAGDNQVEIEGTLDSLTCTAGCDGVPVQEPSSLLLLAAGLTALCHRWRRAT